MEAGSFFIHKPSRLFLQPDPPDAILLGRDMLRLQAAGIDPVRRAETLSLEDFGRLTDAFAGE